MKRQRVLVEQPHIQSMAALVLLIEDFQLTQLNEYLTFKEKFFSKLVFGFGDITYALSLQGKRIQNGNIGIYLFAFIIGICGFLFYLFVNRQ